MKPRFLGSVSMSWRSAEPRSDPRHQLLIHLDYGVAVRGLEIRYSYPFSGPHQLPETLNRLTGEALAANVRSVLDPLSNSLVERIPVPHVIHLPAVTTTPRVMASVTIVIQDSTRELPFARVSWIEAIPELDSRQPKELHVPRAAWSSIDLQPWERLRRLVRAIAWRDYARRYAAALGGMTH